MSTEKRTDDSPVTYLRLEVIATELDVSPAVVRAMARSGELPAIKVGKVWRISPDAYTAWKDDRSKVAERRRRYVMGY